MVRIPLLKDALIVPSEYVELFIISQEKVSSERFSASTYKSSKKTSSESSTV